MKKFLPALLAVLLILQLSGCGSKTPADTSGPEEYIAAEYGKYTAQAEDLSGMLLYDEGTLKDFDAATLELTLENAAGQKWKISVGEYPVASPALVQQLVGKQARVFFTYIGFSNTESLPLGSIAEKGKIELLEDSSVYTKENFRATQEEIITWIESNGKEESASILGRNTDEKQYVIFTGLAVHMDSSLSTLYLYQPTSQGYKRYFICDDYKQANSDISISSGDGVRVYGCVDEKGRFTPLAIQKAQLDYSLETIKAEYKQQCVSAEYRDIVENRENYKGTKLRFEVKVDEVSVDNMGVASLKVHVPPSDDAIIYAETIVSSGEKIIKQGDTLILYGLLMGFKDYEAEPGIIKSYPSFSAQYIDRVE